MIPEIVAVIFLVLPIACFVYIFRGLSTDDNPLWGNVLASAISAIICGMVAIWFFSGTIVSPWVASNATYQMPADLTMDEMLAQQVNASGTVTKLGVGGSGMFIRSAISTAAGVEPVNQTTVTVYTYDIIYQQYQDLGMMMVYLLLCGVSVALFVWFVIELRNELNARDSYDELTDTG